MGEWLTVSVIPIYTCPYDVVAENEHEIFIHWTSFGKTSLYDAMRSWSKLVKKELDAHLL